jgi:Protein of unknown function (DUF3465)
MPDKPMTKNWIQITAIILCASIWSGCGQAVQPTRNTAVADTSIEQAFHNRSSNAQVEGEGVVTRILPDDRDGSRHQKFIVRIPSGLTILIAHNIDIAPRVEDLKEGDTIRFRGEYVWNEKGGLIHQTHHDPTGKHTSGQLVHKGHTYQ